MHFSYSTIPISSTDVIPTDIDDLGRVVGSYGGFYSFLYDFTTNQVRDISVKGASSSFAKGIGADGHVAGYYLTGNDEANNIEFHGYFYDAVTHTTTLFDPPGSTFTVVQDINDAGKIVGFYRTSPLLPDQGFIYDANTGVTTDVYWPTGVIADDINNSGYVIGQYGRNYDQVFVFNSNDGTFTPVGIEGSTHVQFNYINDNGLVTGYYYATDQSKHGFVYDIFSGKITSISVDGDASVSPNRINDDGEIAGAFFDPSKADHGFIYNLNNGESEIVDVDGSSDTFLTAFNNKGQFTGAERDTSGFYHGFVGTIACYCSGTLIATDRGEVPVEELAVGDRAVTAVGTSRPVRWIGHRRIYCRKHPRPETVWPYRVQAGAFGLGRPHRDLYLSPDHCIVVRVMNDLFMTVATLANGATIAQVPVDEVTYWHVELDSHDVILANGLPAESYLDCGNRSDFEDAGPRVTLHPTFTLRLSAEYCLPTVGEGVLVTAVRQRLLARAEALGWTLEESAANVDLLINGVASKAQIHGSVYCFDLPAGASDLRLVSRTFTPRHAVAEAETDRRQLGVLVTCVSVEDAEGHLHGIALDDRSLGAGFHPIEDTGQTRQRWTNGEARFDSAAWPLFGAPCRLHIELHGLLARLWVRRADVPLEVSVGPERRFG